MVSFPNCKINIGLNILQKRTDGYHDLQSIFYPLPIRDALEIIETGDIDNDVIFSASGLPVPGPGENNLCVRAYLLLKKDFPFLPPVKMHLHKVIPMGAGIGGGSADASFMLEMLNKQFELNLSREQLMLYALQLGSDCPFFIINKTCFATGRGEQLHEIPLDLSAYRFLLVHPGIHVSTSLAFAKISVGKNIPPLKQLVQEPISNWKTTIVNDFEAIVFQEYPEIAAIKKQLYEQGALYASMSGSGSAVYGIFANEPASGLNFPPHYFRQWV